MRNHSPTSGLRPLIVAFITLLLAPGVRAEEAEEPHRYQGAYWGVQGHAGLIAPSGEGAGEGATPGMTYGASARISLFASLLDVELKAMAGHYTLVDPDGDPSRVDRLSVGIENHGHPFMVLILQRRPLQQWLTGLYLSLGLDLDLTHREQGDWFIHPGMKLGMGSEYPLTEPDEGWSLWLGINYHYKIALRGVPELGDMNEHLLEVTFGYRNNDIFFMRAPRIDEFEYKNRPYDDR